MASLCVRGSSPSNEEIHAVVIICSAFGSCVDRFLNNTEEAPDALSEHRSLCRSLSGSTRTFWVFVG
ncbi:unnamed protein product [Vitrella brassicaformis CCMP3155]|uniref:Uncharacterized protein n=1 Tax=Vitrella brassicaformis (strain CCMP3155) TaxID=1169540 RepID=A0A0G4GN29_VITBC|nr:unnamed protein product [Vitrella brassicaformis CCMP3155]|eukprot:CEM31606.1 unnamed protein product [Vitrella brassicaformis CCMP3155]